MELQRSRLAAGDGETIGSLSNAVNIHDADVHIAPVNHTLYAQGASYTLASDVTKQDKSIIVTDATGLVIGDLLHITDTSNNSHDHDLLRITSISTNTLTLNRPIDKAYLAASTTINLVVVNMSVVGTLASPISYKVFPSPGEVWHIVSLDFSMEDQTAMDDATFGGLPALTNGVVIRAVDSVNGTYETFSNWEHNGDFKEDGFYVEYSAKAPAGFYGFSGNMNVKERYGAVVRLANTSTETIYLEILIQDNLSGLDSFEVKVHGHIAV